MRKLNNSAREQRAIQARLNGAKSRGPVTPQGKQSSSQNALKHGFHSPKVVLKNENQSDFDTLLASLLDRFQPTDDVEYELVSDLATARWRIQRCQRLETVMFNGIMETNEEDFNRRAEGEPGDIETHRIAEAWRDLVQTTPYLQLTQQEARLQRQYTRALTALLRLRKQANTERAQVQPQQSTEGILTTTPLQNTSSLHKNTQNEPSKLLNPLTIQKGIVHEIQRK